MVDASTLQSSESPLLLRRRSRRSSTAPLKINADVARSCRLEELHVFEEGLVAELRYSLTKLIGQGTTSTVHRAVCADGTEVAMKTMRTSDCEMRSFVEDEYVLLQKLQHPSIIRALDYLALPGKSVLVLELFNGLELSEAVPQAPGGRLEELIAQRLSHAMFDAIAYLHEQGVVHRDVKPQNVLVDLEHQHLKLVDFNTACNQVCNLPLTPTGSRLYAAPEVLLGDSACELSDVWGAGLCTYLMLSGKLPQRRDELSSGVTQRAAATRAIRCSGKRWACISQPCKAMLDLSLAIDPLDRATAAEVLLCEWLQCSPSPQDTTGEARADVADQPSAAPALRRLLWKADGTDNGNLSPGTASTQHSGSFSPADGEQGLADQFWEEPVKFATRSEEQDNLVGGRCP